MNTDTRALVLDLVEWVATSPRPYAEVMDAWRTSCPRLTVWEDANELGLLDCRRDDAGERMVRATPAGLRLLAERRRPAPPR